MIYKRRQFKLIAILMAVFPVAMIFSGLNTALPLIKTHLHTSFTAMEWAVNSFGVMGSSCLVVLGRISDIYGRGRVYSIGAGVLAVGMLLGGCATSVIWVIVAMALVGVAGGIILPVSQTLMISLYRLDESAKPIALWASVVGVGMGVGPLFAGAVVVFNWRYLYLINALIALVSFILLKVLLPKEKTSKGQKVINIKGALLLMLSIASLVVLIMQAHEWSVGMDSLSLLFFILCLSCFLWVEKKSKSPIFFKSLFKHRRFMLAASINFCMNYLTWAVFFLLPLYFQLVGKYNVLQTGFMMLAVTMPLTLLSPLVSKWYMAGNPKKLIVFGFSAIALFLLFQFYHANQYVLLSVVGLIYGAGWALILNPVATIALSSIERESNGVAAGTFITLQEIGGTFGLAVSVSVLSLGNSFIHGYDGCIRSLLVVVLLAVAFTLMLPRQVSSSK